MRHALVCALLLVASGCGPTRPACSPESKTAIKELYSIAVAEVIGSGACDKVQRVENCSAYVVLETHYVAALKVCSQ